MDSLAAAYGTGSDFMPADALHGNLESFGTEKVK